MHARTFLFAASGATVAFVCLDRGAPVSLERPFETHAPIVRGRLLASSASVNAEDSSQPTETMLYVYRASYFTVRSFFLSGAYVSLWSPCWRRKSPVLLDHRGSNDFARPPATLTVQIFLSVFCPQKRSDTSDESRTMNREKVTRYSDGYLIVAIGP